MTKYFLITLTQDSQIQHFRPLGVYNISAVVFRAPHRTGPGNPAYGTDLHSDIGHLTENASLWTPDEGYNYFANLNMKSEDQLQDGRGRGGVVEATVRVRRPGQHQQRNDRITPSLSLAVKILGNRRMIKGFHQYSTIPLKMAVSIPHSLREKLLRNEVASTLSVKLVKSVELPMMAKTAGFDGILVDMEHSSFDLETTSQLCVAALYAGISPIVRVPSKDPFFVSRVLDGGALGVIVPHIRSVQDARDVVAAAKFQPIGTRSSTNGLPHYQFRTIPAKVSNPVTDEATMVIPMIETLEALELVDEIAAVDGVDSLLIGTNDLTAEMGIPGDYENPRLSDAYERTIAACNRRGKWVGVGGLHARMDLVEKFCQMGARWVMAATDGPLLIAGATKRASEMASLSARATAMGNGSS